MTSSRRPKSQQLIPTNNVTTKDGQTVRARIDTALSVAEVIQQLVLSLKMPEPATFYALRDDNDELVTDENLRKKIRSKANLRLVNAPHLEAIEIVDKLYARDVPPGSSGGISNGGPSAPGEETSAAKRANKLRMVLYNLAKFINEEEFANEFLRRDGLKGLVDVINTSHGNPLAYALNAMHNLMELDYGWSEVEEPFIFRIIHILSSPKNLPNVCRPATAILKRLVEADPRFAPRPTVGSSSNAKAIEAGLGIGVYRYGFNIVYEQMRRKLDLLETVVARLASADSVMALNSMMLINTLLSHATDEHWEELSLELERLHIRKAVTSLMSSHVPSHGGGQTNASGGSNSVEDLTSSILDFQANFVRLTYKRKMSPVDLSNEAHRNIMEDLWKQAGIRDIDGDDPTSIGSNGFIGAKGGLNSNGFPLGRGLPTVPLSPGGVGRSPPSGMIRGAGGDMARWRMLGFDSDDITEDFKDVGMLGLDCLRVLAADNPDFFSKAILEQNSRPSERRCPVAKASNEVVELLSEHWAIFAPGYSTSTEFQPFLLDFYRVHALTTQFFIRMWNESGAATGDFDRVAALVRSQIKVALKNETRPVHELTALFIDSEYRDVRDRQLKELELEDDLLNKIPVRNLRAKLFKESYEFVKQQRLHCLMQGAWFLNGVSILPGKDAARRPQRPWRFLRLDNSMKYLHYTDSPYKFQVRNGFEDLPERIEVAAIQEITVNTCTAPPGTNKEAVDLAKTATVSNASSQHSFSLMGDSGPIAHQVATDASRWADWTDGLNMLRKDGGHLATPETAGFVHALTEIGLKIRLLDLSGERVDIPSTLTMGPPPPTSDFFFADLNYDPAT